MRIQLVKDAIRLASMAYAEPSRFDELNKKFDVKDVDEDNKVVEVKDVDVESVGAVDGDT